VTDPAQIRAPKITLGRVTTPPGGSKRIWAPLQPARIQTPVEEPASIVTLAGILVLSVALDFGWKRARAGHLSHAQVGG
jgi:hypothetical protein